MSVNSGMNKAITMKPTTAPCSRARFASRWGIRWTEGELSLHWFGVAKRCSHGLRFTDSVNTNSPSVPVVPRFSEQGKGLLYG